MGGLALATGWLAGLAWQLQQRTLLDAPWPALLMLCGLLLAVLLWRCRVPARWRMPGLLIAAAAVAFGSTDWRAGQRLAERLPAALEGRDLRVQGVIASLPQPGLNGTRFLFEVEQGSLGDQPVVLPPRLSLAWYRGFDAQDLLAAPPQTLRAGQRWQFTVRLKRPHGNSNPGGFDLEGWLFERGIGASGYVRASVGAGSNAGPQLLASDAGGPVLRWRQQIRDAIEQRVESPTLAGVLAALTIGDQAAIEREDWDLFRTTGVAHLMSISGLHVTLFAWLAAAVIGRLWRLSGPLMLRWPAPTAARWGGLLCAAAYAVLAGWGVPAQRTVWMIAVVVLLRSLGLRWPAPLLLLPAALVVTLADPWAMLQPGFWLSFAAVGLLMASDPVTAAPAGSTGWQRWLALLRGGVRTQVIATVGLAPLTLVFFQQISLVGFVANLVAIPLVTLLITPLALAGVLLPWLWPLAAACVQALMHGLAALSAWPGALLYVPAAPAWAMACGLLGGALAVMPLPWRLRLLALPLLLPMLWPAVPRPPAGQFEVLAADVGQGTAVLVRTRQHLLVYDSGPAYSAESDAGQRVLLPLLRWRGEREISLLMLSHRDSDHVGGAAALLREAGVQALSHSLEASHPLLALAHERGVPQQRCAAGQRWAWDGVDFEVLHPAPGAVMEGVKPNTLSCVLRVSSAAGSLLLTGDLEAAQEAALVAQQAPLASTVMLVPHHGSRTSSSPAFLDAVAPQVAVVQAGYRSRFGHPVPEVVARYEARGITVQRSDRCGAWAWHTQQGTQVCQRSVSRRYWHHPAPDPPSD